LTARGTESVNPLIAGRDGASWLFLIALVALFFVAIGAIIVVAFLVGMGQFGS